MRSPFLFLFATCGILHAVNSRQVIVTPAEISGYGDFDADGDLDAIFVQRANGLYRVAFQQPDGSVQWSQTRPSGLPSVDAMTCGPIRVAGKDAVVLAGRLANQMVLVEPSLSAATSTTEQILPSGIAPSSVAALELPVAGNDPALMDLVVHTSENNAPDEDQRHLFRSLSGDTSEVLTADPVFVAERGTRYRYTEGGSQFYAAMLRGSSPRLRVYNSNTVLSNKQTIYVPQNAEFLAGSFSGSPLQHVLIYVKGSPVLQVSRSNGLSLLAKVSHTLEAPIASISPLGSGSFLVIYDGFEYARLYTLTTGGAPIAGQGFVAPLDSRFTGLVALNDNKMSLLAGPFGDAANLALDYEHNGNEWKQTGSTPLPAVGSQVALTNILLYDGEPLIDPGAKLIETIQVPDWTSSLSITSGGNVMVTPETFTSETGGLSAGSALTLSPDTSPTHVLGNQSEGAVSLLSLQTFVGQLPPQVSVSPLPGKFTTEVSPVLSTVDGSTSVFYRFAGDSDWQSATPGAAIEAVGDTLSPFTLQYYATSASGGRSPIYQASYSYYGEPGNLDSDGDGVPDFVEIANGLDPTAGKDADLDAVDDLYELLLGTDPADINSTPTTPLSLNLQNVFDLAVTPFAPTALNTPGLAYPDGASESPADLYLHALDGTLLGHEVTRNISGYLHPTALFEKVPASDRDLFVIVSTSPTFPIQPVVTSDHGRELVALIPVPHQTVGEFDFTYDGVSSTATAAADWLSAAQNHYLSLTRSTIDESLTPDDSLAFLLFERLIQEYLQDRQTLPLNSQLSLTAFRDAEIPTPLAEATAGHPFSVGKDELLALQDWISPSDSGHLLQDVYAGILKGLILSATPEVTAMKKLSSEIAFYSDFVDPNSTPGLYPNPFDTLRGVIAQLEATSSSIDGQIALPGSENGVGYAQDITLSAAEFAAADALLVQLMAAFPARPTTTLTLAVGPDSFQEGKIPLLFTAGGTPYELFRSDGTPYLFQEPLPVGAELEVHAFTDRDHLPAKLGNSLDVISAELVVVPRPSFVDSNFNALDDEWELFFFGQPTDPFDDADGDGYSNLQELLEDTNPTLNGSSPTGPAIALTPPCIVISKLSNGNLQLETEFPSLYSEDIRFALLTQSDLALSFQRVSGSEANDVGNDVYRLEIPLPAESKQFFRFRIELE
ncbi:MAG: hypothetical protein ACSHYB_04355 [Roseibacillus sp.]